MVVNIDHVEGERSSSAATGQKSAATADLDKAQRDSRDTGHIKKSGQNQIKMGK